MSRLLNGSVELRPPRIGGPATQSNRRCGFMLSKPREVEFPSVGSEGIVHTGGQVDMA
jgi:hypothetical protein